MWMLGVYHLSTYEDTVLFELWSYYGRSMELSGLFGGCGMRPGTCEAYCLYVLITMRMRMFL